MKRNNELQKRIFVLILLIMILFVLLLEIGRKKSVLEVRVQSEVEAGEEKMETFLKGGHQIGFISFNLDKDLNIEGKGEVEDWYQFPKPLPLKDMLRESLTEGKKWDIIGFQEMREPPTSKFSDTTLFINIMKELIPERDYRCVLQTVLSDGFFAAICTHFPIVEGSFRERVIFTNEKQTQNRVVICALIQTPAGDIPFCTTHPRAGSDPAAQFRNMQPILFNDILPSYIPSTIIADYRSAYSYSLRARLVLTGDMNYAPNGTEQFSTACNRQWLGAPIPKGANCGIDQVMITNMAHLELGHQPPFQTQYLVSDGAYLDLNRAWPTDHMGPIVSLISTQELLVPIRYATTTIVSAPTSQISNPPQPSIVSATPSPTPIALNVITFNIGAFTIAEEYFDIRIDPIVRYLGKGNYDIIALQETSYGRREGERIASRLEELGFGKFYLSKSDDPKSETDVKRPGPGVYVLSKYPVSTVYSRYGIGRSILSKIQHPQLGELYVTSVHPSNDSHCEQPKEILEKVTREPKEIRDNLILMGDMNSYPYDLETKPKFKAGKGDMCGEEQLLAKFDFSCVSSKECWNAGAVDWILTQKQSVFSIESRNYHPNVYTELGVLGMPGTNWHGVDIHKPVSAKVIVNKPLIVTTLPPSVTPTPFIINNLTIDLNLDGQIDITDFAIFVEYYKEGDEKIDFDKDGKSIRDIDDLSYFIQEYKKEKIDGND
ncbi:endonuclease/exonuclease/phosphatase family protein [Candidatus Dojkabacteria bacterium]|nr:endonuclease/exonuclease/phosphatase family protein [Candidatus Dojkabacteria bacterium]